MADGFERLDQAEEEEERYEVLAQEGGELADEAQPPEERFADELYLASLRGDASEEQLAEALHRVLFAMEREFFFDGLAGRLGSGGRALLSSGLPLRAVLPGGRAMAIRIATAPARGSLRGALGAVATAAVFAGAGAAPLPVLEALGFGGDGGQEDRREAWRSYVTLAREAYDQLAKRLDARSRDPGEASRVAAAALAAAQDQVGAAPARTGAEGERP